MFYRHLFFSTAILWLSACAATQAPMPTNNVATPAELTFFDSRVFDSGLMKTLDNSPSTLTIDFPSRFDLNKMPARIEKWLAAIRDQGGEVRLQQNKRSVTGLDNRGFLLDAVDLVIRTYQNVVEENAIYESIDGYDCIIQYDQVGLVQEIILKRAN